MPHQQPTQVREITVTRRPVNHRGDWVFVALTDDAGHVGYGEASHSTDDAATIALLDGPLSQQIRGQAWDDPASAWRILDAAAPAGRARRVAATAASAVE
jgi:L-alanine-DL-glutamate epimerase-like enolase superfamily enzyme